MRPRRGAAAAAGCLAVAAAALLPPAGGAAAAAEATVAGAVFGPGLLASLTEPVRLGYAYAREDGTTDETVRGEFEMDVREVAEGGRKAVWFDLADGGPRRAFGPVEMTTQNPLVMVFLQRDVTGMERLTGGSQHYFRNRLRDAFNAPTEAEAVEVEFEGRRLPATRLTIRPYASDPRIDRFPQFKGKAYEFTVAEGVPGGVWRLATRVDDPATGELVLGESVTLAAVRPAGAAPAPAGGGQ